MSPVIMTAKVVIKCVRVRACVRACMRVYVLYACIITHHFVFYFIPLEAKLTDFVDLL